MIPKRQRSIETLAQIIAEGTGLSIKELRGSGRTRALSWPRQALMAAAENEGHSLPRIGRYLGGRDHTTVLHGVRSFRERLEAGKVNELGQELWGC